MGGRGNPAQGQGRSLLAMLPQSAPQSSPRNGGTLCPLDLSASPSVQRFSIMALPAADVGRKDCSSGLRLSPCASASVREAKKSSRSAVAARRAVGGHRGRRDLREGSAQGGQMRRTAGTAISQTVGARRGGRGPGDPRLGPRGRQPVSGRSVHKPQRGKRADATRRITGE